MTAALAAALMTGAACKKDQGSGDPNRFRLNHNGADIAVFKYKGERMAVEFDNRTSILKATFTNLGKRRYDLAKGVTDKKNIDKAKTTVVAKVSYTPKGFKVRDDAGKLLWKVNRDPDAVRIFDNDENKNPLSVRLKGKFLNVWEGEGNKNSLGKVEFADKGKKAKVTDGKGKRIYTVKLGTANLKKSSAFGILAMNRIPVLMQYVLISELWLPNATESKKIVAENKAKTPAAPAK